MHVPRANSAHATIAPCTCHWRPRNAHLINLDIFIETPIVVYAGACPTALCRIISIRAAAE
jgi:hypothetical protein